MKKTIIILTIAMACSTAANADNALYKRNQAGVNTATETVLKKEKNVTADNLKFFVDTVFEIYWSQQEVQTQLRTYTKDELDKAVKNLKARSAQLIEENDSLQKVLDETNAKIKVYENRAANMDKQFSDEYAQLDAQKQAVVDKTKDINAEIAALGTEIAQLDSDYTAKQKEILLLEKQRDDLLAQNASQGQLLTDLQGQKGKVQATVDLVDRMLEAAQRASLDKINTDSLQSAIDSYYADQQQIATMLSKAQAAKAQESVIQLEDYVTVSNAYKEAAAITGGRYDAANAAMLTNTLKQKQTDLMPKQAQDIKGIISKLEKQETDTEKFLALVDRVAEDRPVYSANYREEMRVKYFETEPAEKNPTKMTITEALKSPFPAIRKAAEMLSVTLNEDRPDLKNDDNWASYINSIKETVKK